MRKFRVLIESRPFEVDGRTRVKTLFEYKARPEDEDYGSNVIWDLRRGAAVRAAILDGVDLTNANLQGFCFRGQFPEGLRLVGADLRDADLQERYLPGCDLTGADLTGANLVNVSFKEGNLTGCDLSESNLFEADLTNANCTAAKFTDANLRHAHLDGADFSDAKGLQYQIPEGTLVGWTKVDGRLVRLLIPSSAQRTGSMVARRCRCDHAQVLSIEGDDAVASDSDTSLDYRIGEVVRSDGYDGDPRVERANGIDFYLTRAEAEEQ